MDCNAQPKHSDSMQCNSDSGLGEQLLTHKQNQPQQRGLMQSLTD